MSDMQPAEMTGGEAAVRMLQAHGVKTLFCLPGVQNDWLFNAIYDLAPEMRIVHTRHEQGAAYMALGYALATGGPAVFSVVPGPGFLNASAALATAYSLGARVFCLTGQIAAKDIGKGYGVLHEIRDQLGIMGSMTKWSARADSPAAIPDLMNQAFHNLSNGPPGPVGLEIPMDVLADRQAVQLHEPLSDGPTPIDEDAVERAAALLGQAEKPMIFVGSGAQNVGAEVTALAEALQAPVIGYRTGMGVVDGRSDYSLHQPAAQPLWAETDAVLAIGSHMRVPMQKWLKRHRPQIIRIDVDPDSHEKFTVPDAAITGWCEDALPALLERLPRHNRNRPSRRDELKAAKAAWRSRVAVLQPQLRYLEIIREELGEDGVFVDELTQVGFASRIAYPVYKPRTFISTGYQGTLGYGFATGLGVKLARPDAPVISVNGDGGFLFTAQELATGVQQKIPLISLVFNNDQYGNVQQLQKHDYGGRIIASDLHNPDFVKLADSFGAQGLRADSDAALRQAIRAGREVDVPTVIDIPVGDMPSVDRFR